MSVVTEICKKVAIIDGGELVEEGDVEKIFENPGSDAAKELIFEKKESFAPVRTLNTSNRIRIVFSENSAYEPVISNAIMTFKAPLNILKADTKNVGGKARGEMILGLPEDESVKLAFIEFFKEQGLAVSEVTEDV